MDAQLESSLLPSISSLSWNGIDLLLVAAQVARARQLYASDEQFQSGSYISEKEEINALLKRPLGFPRWARGQTPARRPCGSR